MTAGSGTAAISAGPVAHRCSVVWAEPAEFGTDAVALLDAGERRRLGALRQPADRQRFLAAHVLTRVVLGGVLDADPAALRFVHRCATCGGPHGKPALEKGVTPLTAQYGVTPLLERGPEFSVSHAGDRVVVAVADVPVGVDVEVVPAGFDPDEFAAAALTPAERRALAALPAGERTAAVLRAWVRKEAVLKATGRGLAVPPDRVELSPPDAPPAVLAWRADDPPADVALVDLDLGPSRPAALAVLAPGPFDVTVRRHAAGVTFARVVAG